MPLIPNVDAYLTKRVGTNEYGEPVYGVATRRRCAIVKLESMTEKTPVRTDSSASRGASDQTKDTAVLLFRSDVDIDIGDKIVVLGFSVKVLGVYPRVTIPGKIDHYRVECGRWD